MKKTSVEGTDDGVGRCLSLPQMDGFVPWIVAAFNAKEKMYNFS